MLIPNPPEEAELSEATGTPEKKVAHCCCGALRAEITGEPIGMAVCFCEQCQRRTGSAFGVSVYYMKDQIKLVGPSKVFVREGQEGRKLQIWFCPECGSSVYWENPARRPGQCGVAFGAIFDRDDLPSPTVSIWEKNKPSWLPSIPAALHTPLGNAPVPPSR